MPKIADHLARLSANIEALVAELREHRRRAERNNTRDEAASEAERGG